jgi:hypothetical protein
LTTTPQTIASILGTDVHVLAEQSQPYPCTCYGETEISARKQPAFKETIISSNHDVPKYILQEGQQSLIEPTLFINHDDDELLLIETLVGPKTTFTRNLHSC